LFFCLILVITKSEDYVFHFQLLKKISSLFKVELLNPARFAKNNNSPGATEKR